jgi:hypothetical protein
MSNNGYLQRRNDVQNAIMRAAERLTEQFMEDTLEVTLHRKGYGYKRVTEIINDWEAVRKEYSIALQPSDPEADVAQDHMDAEIQAICKDEFQIQPFIERYPELKRISYEVRRCGKR